MQRLRFTVGLGLWMFLVIAPAFGADFRIVPGQRVGSVMLGMAPRTVSAALNAPDKIRRLPQDIVLETWLGHVSLGKPRETGKDDRFHDYLTVFFQHHRAVQIEVSAAIFTAPGGLTTNSDATAFQKRFRPCRSIFHDWKATDPQMDSPACKHLLFYGDDASAGIAWKQGAWSCAAPDPDPEPEAIIVHQPGVPVRLNPNDADDYAGTELPHERHTHRKF